MGRHANVSSQTAKRILNSKGYKYSKFYKRVYLNEERREERVEFAQRMLDEEFDWSKVLISDECSIWLNKCKPKTLWTKNTMLEEGSDTHGPKIHCWGGITARGALRLEIFEKNLEAKGYLKIIKRKKVEMDQLYPDGWVFQHDGSGVHRADIVKRYLDTFEEEPLSWPGYSPDLSPIENIWGWLKHEVSKEMPSDIQRLKACVRRHWRRINAIFQDHISRR